MKTEDDLDLVEMAQALRDEWRTLLGVTALFTVAALVIAFVVTERYRAEVVVSPITDSPTASGSNLSRQLGGLVGLTGIDLSNLTQSSQLSIPYLQSRALVEKFIQTNELLPVLFEDEWDEERGRWKVTGNGVPTLWKATETFVEDVLRIDIDQRTGVITLSVEWQDPERASNWANGLVALANEELRKRDLAEAERNVAYLKEQISQTGIVGIQTAMFNLIENEMKTIMLASIRHEYAFAVVDPAVPPEERSKPNRPLIVIIGMFFGALAASGSVTLRRLFANPPGSGTNAAEPAPGI